MKKLIKLLVIASIFISMSSCAYMQSYGYKEYNGVFKRGGNLVETYEHWRVRQDIYKLKGGKGRLRAKYKFQYIHTTEELLIIRQQLSKKTK